MSADITFMSFIPSNDIILALIITYYEQGRPGDLRG